jgi:hypothetical protein
MHYWHFDRRSFRLCSRAATSGRWARNLGFLCGRCLHDQLRRADATMAGAGVGSRLIREKRFVDFAKFIRSRLWRAMLRLLQDHFIGLLRSAKRSAWLQQVVAIDPLFEHELNMRLLIKSVAPGIAGLDCEPIALRTSAVLLRTALTSDSDEGWRQRCPQLEIVQITGNHETIFEPQSFSALSGAFSEATRNWQLK